MSYTVVPKPTDSTYTLNPRDSVEYPQYGYALYGIGKYGRQDTYSRVGKPNTLETWADATYSWSLANSKWGSPQYTTINKPI